MFDEKGTMTTERQHAEEKEAQSGTTTALLHEFANELETVVAEGCEIVPRRDGSETRIRYEAMDPDTRLMFLNLAVDFTDYVNRGMEPAHGNRVIQNVLASKKRSRWLEGVLGDDLQGAPRK
jgi:hypothetical protein